MYVYLYKYIQITQVNIFWVLIKFFVGVDRPPKKCSDDLWSTNNNTWPTELGHQAIPSSVGSGTCVLEFELKFQIMCTSDHWAITQLLHTFFRSQNRE